MKSRSHRLPISESHDDWVDESWTVDCVCGVNFDDGEEMVNCDECGVWVHTRCSRYVKSEKSFACDKCKSKNNGCGGGIGNDSEETEVAEFLVELPTKTLRIGNSNPASVSSRRPARLWTDIPLEERVHVQGIPGGDPGLFSGVKMSSVFGPELWKSAGYVPKKFNFPYAEFPCWNDGDMEEKKEDEINKRCSEGDNQADNGAGVLFSLSKENEITLPTTVVDSIGAKSAIEGDGCHGLLSPKHKKKLDGEIPDIACSEDSLKERSSVQPIFLRCGKRKKETFGISKDQNSKKKVRTYEKEGDVKKQAAHASKAASSLSSDAKQLEFPKDRRFKAVSDGIQYVRDVLGGELSDGLGECATNLASNEKGPEPTLDGISRERNEGDQVATRSGSLAKCNNGASALTELYESRSTPVKEEVREVLQKSPDIGVGIGDGVGIGLQDKDPLVVDVIIAGPDTKKVKHAQDSNIDLANSLPNKKMKAELDIEDRGGLPMQSSSLDGVKFSTMKAGTQHSDSTANLCSEVIKSSVKSSEDGEHKVPDGGRSLNAASSKTDKCDDSSDNPYQSKREPTGSEVTIGAKKRSSVLAHSFEVGKETLKSSNAVTSHSASYQRKVVVPVGKSTSTSAGIMSKFSDNRVATTAQNPTLDSSRQKDLSETTVETVKEFSSIDTVKNEEKCGRPKKFVKEPSRLNSLPETSLSTKLSQTSDSKRLSSDSKDSTTHSSSKVSLMPNVTAASGSGDCASPPPVEGTSNVQNKAAGSVVPGKVDKFYQSGSHPSSRGNVASVVAPPSSNVPAALSDEELALLLHQELNSSPRVPRVPRMRHAGSLPQLNCPTASSMLMKRTSSSGGKDHSMSSRRKMKDFSRDSSHPSVEGDNQTKKVDRKPSSPDNRRRDSGCSVDRLSRREANGGSVKGGHSMKMTNVSSSLSSSTDANGYNVSSSHPSSRNSSDDGPRILGRPTNRTLPGLIAEIMSEGKRMTYEELCNAVLPHWPHLRKHNGERYAYSSHSQAVLDCLRNRSEWARLVDRGPKTSASRKRRKFDADSVSVESEDNDDSRGKNLKDVGSKSFESHQEDFPKGKRKARQRGRLALQGRGVVRRRRRNDVVSDDESESFSNSSEDSMSSEEEIEGGNTSIVGNEASASSEEVQ